MERLRVDGRAEVLDDQVPVGPGRDPHVAVPHQPLDAVHIDTGAEQRGREGVPQVVEAHRDMQRHRPEPPTAGQGNGMASAVGGLLARRAESRLGVVGLFLVRAPAATMLVSADDARPGQGVAKDLLRIGLTRALRPVRSGKDQRARRVLELVLEPGAERGRDRQHCSVPALRRIAVVRARDRHGATGHVDVGLAEPEQLALAQPQGGAASEERAPVLRDLDEHPAELVRRQRLVDPLRHLPALDRIDRVVAHPAAGLLSLREDDVQLRAEVVERRRRRAGGLELMQQLVEVRGAEGCQRNLPDRAADYVFLQARGRTAFPARSRAAVGEPPGADLGERAGQVLRPAFQSPALEPSSPLEPGRQFFRLSLVARRNNLACAIALRVDIDGAPALAVPFDGRHALPAPLAAKRYHGRGLQLTSSVRHQVGRYEAEPPGHALRAREIAPLGGLVDP